VNRSRRLHPAVLVFLVVGLLGLLALGFAMRSCLRPSQSAEAEVADHPASEEPTPERSNVVAPPRRLVTPGLSQGASKRQRALPEQSADPRDAEPAVVVPTLTNDEAKSLELRRDLANKDKLKVRQLRPGGAQP